MRRVRASERRTLSETPRSFPAFHPGVVNGAHAGELGDLLAAQPGDAALTVEDRHTGSLGADAAWSVLVGRLPQAPLWPVGFQGA
jgi:hypothetical protein